MNDIFKRGVLRRILENIQHLKQKVESLFIMTQKQSSF